MDSSISFQGLGPFHLPTAQRTKVAGNPNNGVTAFLYCLLPDRGPDPVAVQIQMPVRIAQTLSVQLMQAATKIDSGSA